MTSQDQNTSTHGLDNDRLGSIYARKGPFVTAYLDADARAGEGRAPLDLRWKNLRRELADDGAPEQTLAAMDEVVTDSGEFDATLLAVADHDGVLLDGAIGAASERDMAWYHELPRLAPLLAWRSQQVPYVAVLADRVGADIAVVDVDALSHAVSVDGSATHITRSAPGGWSQRRYQQRAENQWDRNAAEVAAEVARLADEISAAFIAVGGDVRAVQFLSEHLDDRHRELLREIRGGRHPGDDLDGAADDVVRLQATAAAEHVVSVLGEFAAARAASGAVDGADATFEALQRGMVDRLLVVDELQPGGTSPHCWITNDPMLLSAEGESLRSLGATPRRAPTSDAAIRAALAQGAEVVVVPAHGPSAPRGGLGAVLRG